MTRTLGGPSSGGVCALSRVGRAAASGKMAQAKQSLRTRACMVLLGIAEMNKPGVRVRNYWAWEEGTNEPNGNAQESARVLTFTTVATLVLFAVSCQLRELRCASRTIARLISCGIESSDGAVQGFDAVRGHRVVSARD